MSIVADIATYLASNGYGIWKNADPAINTIFLDEFQDMPDNQIAIFGSGHEGFQVVSGPCILENVYFDIQVRNVSKATARMITDNIRKLLRYNLEVPGYYKILGTPPYFKYLGKDDNNRYKFAAFFIASNVGGL